MASPLNLTVVRAEKRIAPHTPMIKTNAVTYVISRQTLSLLLLYAHQQHMTVADVIEQILRNWLNVALGN